VSLEFFIYIILTSPLWTWSTQALADMSTGIFPLGVKTAGSYGWQPYHLYVPIVLKSGSLNLLEPSGPVQAPNGIALPFYSLGTHLPSHSHSKMQNSYIPRKYVVLIFRLFSRLSWCIVNALKFSIILFACYELILWGSSWDANGNSSQRND